MIAFIASLFRRRDMLEHSDNILNAIESEIDVLDPGELKGRNG